MLLLKCQTNTLACIRILVTEESEGILGLETKREGKVTVASVFTKRKTAFGG